MFFILGLGNPGPKYYYTRHNLGFRIIDYIIEKKLSQSDRPIKKHQSIIQEILLERKKVFLIKPLTFMNLSGQAFENLKRAYPFKNSLILYDDYYLPFGKIKLKKDGSHGGHNGIKSIIETTGTKFNRLRLGIGSDPKKENNKSYPQSLEKYVLSKFNIQEEKQILAYSEFVFQIILCYIKNGLEKTMNQFNGKYFTT